MSDTDLLFAYPIIFASILIDGLSIIQVDQYGPRSSVDVCVNV